MMVSSLVGCAKTHVRETNEVADSGLPRPAQVLIDNFAVTPADVKENSGVLSRLHRTLRQTDQTAEEVALGREVADALATELVRKVLGMGLNPLRADRNMPVNPGSILVGRHQLFVSPLQPRLKL
jgi:hypothetical protein